MHGSMNIKFINAKQATDVHAYKNIKRKLHKTNAAIWFNIKPVAASTVEVPDDERHNARNMLNY